VTSTSMFRQMAGLRRVHFVGIGGAGMSGIAEVLLDYDIEVTGSDQAASEATRRLEELGIPVAIGHAADHVHGADLVVRSSAIREDNPEVVAARRRGITVIRRAEMLAELMRLKYGIAIAGTHGKTTTTSLVGTILTEAGLDPTVIVGGRLRVSGTGARLGKSTYLVAEADEFDRSFLRLAPILAVITTIDVDHLDTYRDLDDIRDAFAQFAGSVPFFGQVITCLDDPNVQALLPRLAERRVVTYGFSPQADLVAMDVRSEGGGSRFTVRHAQRGTLGEITLPLPGRHNVQNALAAVAVALAVGLDFAEIARGIAAFTGVHRRFERLGTFGGAVVVDDYAHHPVEVAATLQAAREAFPAARVVAVFQPHLYSRTQQLAAEFGRSLLGADVAWVTDVYAAREEPIPGVGGELVVEAARASGHRNVRFCPDWRELPAALAETLGPGDLLLTMGAGDVYKLGHSLVAAGRERGGEGAAAPGAARSPGGAA
jgi:UDP-N-acetylmuramate--alanine ligase